MVTVNFKLNESYLVDKTAFEKIVKKAGQNAKLLKIKEASVFVAESKNDYRVEITVEVKKGSSYKEAIQSFTKELDKFSLNLIDSKPENVTVIIDGEY